MVTHRIAIALVGVSLLSGGLATPTAHADDPLAPIRGTVNGDRARTTCQALTYNLVLEEAAQTSVRFKPMEPVLARYSGKTTDFYGFGDPQAEAINKAYKQGAGDVIGDCTYTEFGVGFIRRDSGYSSSDAVAIVFGTPAKAAAPSPPTPASEPTLVPTPAVQQCPAGSPTPTVPAFGTCAPLAPPKNKVSVSFIKGLQWTVNVTSAADIAGKCAYTASSPVLPGSKKNFDIGPRGSASFTVLAPPPFSTYHVVVSCSGTFDGTTVEFGHVEQDVSA